VGGLLVEGLELRRPGVRGGRLHKAGRYAESCGVRKTPRGEVRSSFAEGPFDLRFPRATLTLDPDDITASLRTPGRSINYRSA
jgi:hypothetical protein